jgi:hypothetical protein
MGRLTDVQLLEEPQEELLREVTGLFIGPPGRVLIDGLGVRSTHRLAIGGVGGGVALFTWPAELKKQALYLYGSGRENGSLRWHWRTGWDIATRPQLAFRMSPASERLYLTPTIGPAQYIAQWSGSDLRRVGRYEPAAIRPILWPWLLDRGYASMGDEAELEPFLTRLRVKEQEYAFLRPGLRLLRRWSPEQVADLRAPGRLVAEVRTAVKSAGWGRRGPAAPCGGRPRAPARSGALSHSPAAARRAAPAPRGRLGLLSSPPVRVGGQWCPQ